MKNITDRADFLKITIRVIMGSLLAFIAILLGRRITIVNDCNSCPGLDICRGEADCSKFLAETRQNERE